MLRLCSLYFVVLSAVDDLFANRVLPKIKAKFPSSQIFLFIDLDLLVGFFGGGVGVGHVVADYFNFVGHTFACIVG